MGKMIPPVEAPHVAKDTATALFLLKYVGKMDTIGANKNP